MLTILLLSAVLQHAAYNPNVPDCRELSFDAPAWEVKGPCFRVEDGERIYEPGRGVAYPKPIQYRGVYVNKSDILHSSKKDRKKHETLKIRVDALGNVRILGILASISPSVDRAALEQVSRWKFEPTVFNGSVVAVEFNLVAPVYFKNGKCYSC